MLASSRDCKIAEFQRKMAWAYNAYDFWASQSSPAYGYFCTDIIAAWTNADLPGKFTLVAVRE